MSYSFRKVLGGQLQPSMQDSEHRVCGSDIERQVEVHELPHC